MKVFRNRRSSRSSHYRAIGRLFIVLIVVCLASAPLWAEKDEWSGVERIVAIGDVHGDYVQFVQVLRSAGLIDEKEKWSGGDTHLVQTGDIVDRGAGSRKAMDLLMTLEKQARKRGGAVHALIGNHEAMNVYGDLRYVAPGEFAAFQKPDSEQTRDHFYERHVDQLKESPPPEGLPEFDDAYREKWNAEHPLGYFEHRYAFGPRGEYGKWIRGHNTVIKINDTVFLHGGISPKYSGMEIGEINERVREELEDFSKLRGGILMDTEGPVWYRGFAKESGPAIEAHLEQVLANLDARRIVMGHTVTAGAVIPRFDGRVVLIDVGLGSHYGGRQACLVLEQGAAYALHRGKRIPLPKSDHGLAEYLQSAAALDPEPSPLQPLIEKLAVPAGP